MQDQEELEDQEEEAVELPEDVDVEEKWEVMEVEKEEVMEVSAEEEDMVTEEEGMEERGEDAAMVAVVVEIGKEDMEEVIAKNNSIAEWLIYALRSRPQHQARRWTAWRWWRIWTRRWW